ncbi:MAG TPA: 3-isopropylmalate dehydratase large subunit [Firmicutes bacterium]|jgi:3-isopropylmalate/(R)-2-methylmalate dehydratase large subunit|nr:3-isopropylmalate dehydratase large subunit [Bacillota bacterium]
MGMTMGEKILARASGKEAVKPGEIITARVDLCMTNDATTHISIDIFEKQLQVRKIFAPERVVFIIDHNVPSESVKTAEVQKKMRDFAREHRVNFYEGAGVCHQIMIEEFVSPGQLVVAADSHTCSYGGIGALGIGVGSTDFTAVMNTGEIWLMVPETLKFNIYGQFKKGVYARDLILKIIKDIGANGANYKIMEFGGPAIKDFTIDDRIVLCNMAVEAGAKSGLIEPDEKVVDYINARGRREMYLFKSDEDAVYEKVYDYDLAMLEPMVAKPHFVDNGCPVSEISDVKIDQGFIGSCNNGRIEELRVAARILKGRKIHPQVRLLVTPASKEVYLQALKEGLVDIFVASGAMVLNPNCSVCWGGCQGVIGEGETLISTGTRNFKGRAGHADSYVYLASAATVAASALTGKITDPRGWEHE